MPLLKAHGASEVDICASESIVQVLRWQMEAFSHEASASILEGIAVPAKLEFRLGHSANEVKEDDSIIKERHNVHTAARSMKLAIANTLINGIRINSPDDRIVVFSTRNDALKDLQALHPGEMYIGTRTVEQRDRIISDFEKQPGGSVLYVATKAGGVGINLAVANRMILLDASWNPVDDEQAVSRCYRMGQQKKTY